nr:hypothetical protein [Tanacetum cinerariifolium]
AVDPAAGHHRNQLDPRHHGHAGVVRHDRRGAQRRGRALRPVRNDHHAAGGTAAGHG